MYVAIGLDLGRGLLPTVSDKAVVLGPVRDCVARITDGRAAGDL